MMEFETPAKVPVSGSTLGQRIKAIRLAWRWSQQEVANALHMDQASISFWERDKVLPSGSALVALASLFRTSAKALEQGQGFRIPDPPSLPATEKADRVNQVTISLPMGDKDLPMVVDLASGSSRDLQLSEAMVSLVQGVKDGRRLWLVLE